MYYMKITLSNHWIWVGAPNKPETATADVVFAFGTPQVRCCEQKLNRQHESQLFLMLKAVTQSDSDNWYPFTDKIVRIDRKNNPVEIDIARPRFKRKGILGSEKTSYFNICKSI